LTEAYRLLAEPKEATEDEATTDATKANDTTDATETADANEANGDAQSTAEATKGTKPTKQAKGRPARRTKAKPANAKSENAKAHKTKAKKGHSKKFKKMCESVSDAWVDKVDQAVQGLVNGHADACENDPAHMLALAGVLRKRADIIEAEIAENT
jgi:hypothetical protein